MGFFSKLYKKTIGKVFKAVGKGIKSIAKAINKLGIVGQIAMFFILPVVGGMLVKGLAIAGGALSASSNIIISGLGNVYKTVTQGVKGFIKTVGGKVLEKVGIKAATDGTLREAFSSWASNTMTEAKGIFDPLKMSNTQLINSVSPPTTLSNTGKNIDPKIPEAPVTSGDKLIKGFYNKNPEEIGNYITQSIEDSYTAANNNPSVYDEIKGAVVDTVKTAPARLIGAQIDTAISGQPQEDPKIKQINPVLSYVNEVDKASQAQGYGVGGTIQNALDFSFLINKNTQPAYIPNFG
jgi:hypothetical protein